MRVSVSFKMRSWEQEDDMRHRIGDLAGRGHVASGFCLLTDTRDFDYTFRDPRRAKAFLRAVKRIRGVRAEVV